MNARTFVLALSFLLIPAACGKPTAEQRINCETNRTKLRLSKVGDLIEDSDGQLWRICGVFGGEEFSITRGGGNTRLAGGTHILNLRTCLDWPHRVYRVVKKHDEEYPFLAVQFLNGNEW